MVLNQTKNGFRPCRLLDELLLSAEDFRVHSFHALLGERAGIFDFLPALTVGPGVQHAAWTIILLKFRILRVVISLRLLLGVQVVKIAKKLVEAMHRRQM